MCTGYLCKQTLTTRNFREYFAKKINTHLSLKTAHLFPKLHTYQLVLHKLRFILKLDYFVAPKTSITPKTYGQIRYRNIAYSIVLSM